MCVRERKTQSHIFAERERERESHIFAENQKKKEVNKEKRLTGVRKKILLLIYGHLIQTCVPGG